LTGRQLFTDMPKTAVVLFNLGGPDTPAAVRPFLFNLFNDKAIIGAPQPVRWLIARLISGRRAPVATAIYASLGGRSPIMPNTEAQAGALQSVLGDDFQVFIAMRYWHPLTAATVAAVRASGADRVVLLPLYPQYSTTTTASSAKLWQEEAVRADLSMPVHTVCCYPTASGWIQSLVDGIRATAPDVSRYRLLFSAHGLPQKIVDRGDPYQWQVEQTAAAVVDALGGHPDPVVCYQSKVGPLKWLEPSTEHEIQRAGADGKPVMVVPVAFVSEHSETLVELDQEYRQLAETAGVPEYLRVPTVATSPAFIGELADMVRAAVACTAGSVSSETGQRLCPAGAVQCPCQKQRQ
jgi:protoporphyrin/coproporphyrin ferrochelatase